MHVPDWDLPKKITDRLGLRSAGRQRAIYEDGHLLIVLHEPPGLDHNERRGAYFWRTELGEWKYSGRGNGITCLRGHLDSYRKAEDRIEQMYERAGCARDFFEILELLVPLRRAARNQAVALQAARDLVRGDRELIEMRDTAGELDRALEILYDDTRNALEFDVAKSAEAQARLSQKAAVAGHRLNVLAAVFFPLTAVASVLGVNMPLGVEDAPTWMTWSVIAIGLGIGGVLLAWVLQSDPSDD